jgi:hypothetical protein
MFYRFHSSVCLVDIWRHSYEPGEFAHWFEEALNQYKWFSIETKLDLRWLHC